jgi:2-phosphosulfolactate phosphatase
MRKTVVIDCFPESVARYRTGYVVVAIDVVRATTTAMTAVASGRRCFPVCTVDAAFKLARRLTGALLVGEQGGIIPSGFDLNNSPTELLARTDIDRPVILLSSSGTRLLFEASKCDVAILACLRNYSSAADYVARHFSQVAVIGAGSTGEFREEDQMCCAWIAERLLTDGYTPGNLETLHAIKRWTGRPIDSWINNKSAAYLRVSRQTADLDFILSSVADLDATFTLQDGEVVMTGHVNELRV